MSISVLEVVSSKESYIGVNEYLEKDLIIGIWNRLEGKIPIQTWRDKEEAATIITVGLSKDEHPNASRHVCEVLKNVIDDYRQQPVDHQRVELEPFIAVLSS